MSYLAALKDAELQSFSNPYDAMAALLDTDGEADVYVEVNGQRETLLHRDREGRWSAMS